MRGARRQRSERGRAPPSAAGRESRGGRRAVGDASRRCVRGGTAPSPCVHVTSAQLFELNKYTFNRKKSNRNELDVRGALVGNDSGSSSGNGCELREEGKDADVDYPYQHRVVREERCYPGS